MTRVVRRLPAVIAVAVAAIVAAAGVANAGFTSAPVATQVVSGATIPVGPTPTASASGSSVALTFTAITLGDGRAMDAYQADRFDASGNVVATDVTCTSSAGGCTVANVPDGTWRFQVRGVFRTWTGPYGVSSPAVTVATAPVLTITGVVRDGGNKKVHFTGTGAVATTTIVVTMCTSSSFPCASANTVGTSTATNPSAGSWTSAQSGPSNLANGTTYYAQATQGASSSAVYSFTVTGL